VLAAKQAFVERSVPDPIYAAREVGSSTHQQAAIDLARRTITVVRDTAGALPLPRDLGDALVVLSPLGSRRTKMEQWTYGQSALGREIALRASGALEIPVEYPVEDLRTLSPTIERAEAIVVGLLNAQLDEDQVAFVRWLRQTAPTARLVGVGLRTPYDVLGLPELQTYVCAYTSVEPSMIALAEVLFGERPARGRLPVLLDEGQGDAE
jgi:beta-N-acetylhexosaminidase